VYHVRAGAYAKVPELDIFVLSITSWRMRPDDLYGVHDVQASEARCIPSNATCAAVM